MATLWKVLTCCVIFLGFTPLAWGQVNWVPASNHSGIHPYAILGANGDNVNQYVCRANFNGGVHPGKAFNRPMADGGFSCNIGWGGQEHVINNFEIATGPTGRWGPPGQGNFLLGGSQGGVPIGVCRAQVVIQRQYGFGHVGPGGFCIFTCYEDEPHGMHLGKLWNNVCHVGWGGDEKQINQYEVFYPQ